METVTQKFTIPCVKQIANGNFLYDSGNSNLVLCDNLEEWDGVEGRTEGSKREET